MWKFRWHSSKDELPTDEFLVIPIAGLSINGHIDPRSQEIGYLCLMGRNVPQKRFFDWFYEEITVATSSSIRKKYSYNPTANDEVIDIPIDQRFILWGDSDIPYLQQMTSPERISRATQNGILFAKIGAKITETSQPLDLGPFFKILKQSGKYMTSVGIVKPLSLTVDRLFSDLKGEGRLSLSHLKENALKDLLVTAPDMMAKAFNKDSVIKSYMDCGMLDQKYGRCPDIFQITKSFKCKWEKVPGGKPWFMSTLPYVIAEMYSNGEVPENFYDENSFPLDKDNDGNVWKLRSEADHLTRSKVMYHPTVIEKKTEDIRVALHAKQVKANAVYNDGKQLIECNRDCETELLKYLSTSLDKDTTVTDLCHVTIAMLEKSMQDYWEPFINVGFRKM